ncbi:hypothetical protein LTR66_002467 [Elasticomyces elasticus]|nr:hypothetical protein LTR66_002467 [Elasticomyces elasticus]
MLRPLVFEGWSYRSRKKPLTDVAWNAAQTKELESLRRRFNDGCLLRRASEHNYGIDCRLDDADPLGRSLMGGMHVHLCLRFADGSVWLARILPHNVTSFSDELSNSTLRSECATLRWLEMVGVPAPRLHGYGFRNDLRNDVGVAYMLIDELPGKPLSQLEPCEPQMRTAYAGLASILCTLSEHTFDQIGSLTFAPDGGTQIGPITGDRAGTLSQIGPFQEATQYYIT